MEHHEWVSINAPSHSEACFYLELGILEDLALTAEAGSKWDLHPGSDGSKRSALPIGRFDDKQKSCGPILRRRSIETRYSLNVRLKLLCFQTGNFIAHHPNNCANVRWMFRYYSDIQEVFLNFRGVLILDRSP